MLTAKTVQEMLDVADDVVIAHGYSYDRGTTYDIWFHQGKIHRYGDTTGPYGDRKNVPPCTHESSEVFQPEYFYSNIKRWYESGFNTKLLELFDTFGRGLPLTPGGHYPNYPPIYLD